jgi:hypothetical protein
VSLFRDQFSQGGDCGDPRGACMAEAPEVAARGTSEWLRSHGVRDARHPMRGVALTHSARDTTPVGSTGIRSGAFKPYCFRFSEACIGM